MRDYKLKETLLSLKQSIDALKEKFEVLLEVLDEEQQNDEHS